MINNFFLKQMYHKSLGKIMKCSAGENILLYFRGHYKALLTSLRLENIT